jgi:hypothetical protein
VLAGVTLRFSISRLSLPGAASLLAAIADAASLVGLAAGLRASGHLAFAPLSLTRFASMACATGFGVGAAGTCAVCPILSHHSFGVKLRWPSATEVALSSTCHKLGASEWCQRVDDEADASDASSTLCIHVFSRNSRTNARLRLCTGKKTPGDSVPVPYCMY